MSEIIRTEDIVKTFQSARSASQPKLKMENGKWKIIGYDLVTYGQSKLTKNTKVKCP